VDTARYAALFLTESQEHLHHCDAHLLAWERAPAATEPVNGLFRALHTIKGMAATMGHVRLAEFAHDAESLLDAVRAGRVRPTPDLVGLMFEAVDAIAAGVEDAASGSDGRRLDPQLVERLATLAKGEATTGAPSLVVEEPAVAVAGEGRWVTVTIRSGVTMAWARALIVLRKAGGLGTVSGVAPDPATVDPDDFAGRVAFRLETAQAPEAVRAALLEVGDVASVEVGGDAPGSRAGPPGGRQELRVDRRELDRLVSEVGELVVARNRLAALVEGGADPAIEEAAAQISRLTDSVHHRVMRVRMVPVAEVFDRFPRMVRDLARQLGKTVRLEVAGREIELDRSVLEAIGDPLLHLLRNALDHGMEPPDDRIAQGKPAEGVIRLEAHRERNQVLITVSDDGRGVDRDRIAVRLSEAGELADLADDEVLLRVLGRAGFSTAREVTGVSGRGVGIDAVMAQLRELGGVVGLRSEVGRGTTFTLRLPLTLAVLPVLLVGVGEERYAVPLARVLETGRGRVDDGGIGERVTFRGGELPAVDLRRAVGLPKAPADLMRPFLVIPAGERRGALLVDRLLGRQDLVIEAVELPRGAPGWLAGAAILADGLPAFLLDPTGLI